MAEDKTFRMLIEEQKRTTDAISNLVTTNEETSVNEIEKREKSESRIVAGRKAWETRQANLLAQQNPNSAANKEKQDEQNTYLKDTFGKFLGKDSSFAKGLSSIGQSLKQKVQGGIAGIFTALKAGAFLLFLGGMVKFLQSPTFKELQDKYLPIIADGLQSLYDTLKSIASGFFVTDPDTGKTTFSAAAGLSNIMSMITSSFLGWITSLKDAFYDEEGNFTLTGGIKNLAGDFATILASITAFGLLLAPRLFFGTLWQIGKGGGGLAIRALGKVARGFGSLFTSIGGFNTSLADTGTTMSNKVATSKKTGVFRKGLGGIAGRFGRLFRFFGRRGLIGLMIGAGVGMATMLADTKVFSSIGENFGKLFTKAGEFGSKVATSATNMATRLGTAVKTGVFSVASGIGAKFNSLFGVLSDFGSNIAKVASKAATKAASVVAKSLDDVAKIGAKVVESVVPTKKLNKKQLDALRGTGEFALKPKVKASAPKLSSAQRAALSGTGEFAFNPKVAAATSTTAAKATTQATLKKGLWKSLAKKIPLLSVFAGTGFAIQRAMGGEYSKAFLEFASGVAGVFPGPGTAASIAIDAGLLADDLGISVDDAKKLILANGGKVAKAEVKPSGTAKPMNLANVKTYGDYLRVKDQMRVNPSYDTDGDGVYSKLEFRRATQGAKLEGSGSKFAQGPVFMSAPTVNNNQNNIQSSPIVPLDPLMREAISAM